MYLGNPKTSRLWMEPRLGVKTSHPVYGPRLGGSFLLLLFTDFRVGIIGKNDAWAVQSQVKYYRRETGTSRGQYGRKHSSLGPNKFTLSSAFHTSLPYLHPAFIAPIHGCTCMYKLASLPCLPGFLASSLPSFSASAKQTCRHVAMPCSHADMHTCTHAAMQMDAARPPALPPALPDGTTDGNKLHHIITH